MTRARARGEIAWGGVDQCLSSATNLGLSILAGRLLGAAGLGVIFLGFSAYLVVLSLVRGFITAPFVVATAALDRAERDAQTGKCMTLVFCTAVATSAIMVVVGFAVPGPLGRSFLVFAPWVGVAIVQDQWRSVLFRDQRGAAAALNEAVWAAGMIVVLPFAWASSSEWSVAAMWGAGAAFAALLGAWQVGLRPGSITESARWWKRDIRRLGSWLALESILASAGTQLIVIILAAVLSESELGGIRVVQVAFAPVTLVTEALVFPGVPIMTRALASSLADARRWAWRLGLGALAIVGLYLSVVGPLSGQVLSKVFGPEFEQYTSLVIPTALAQLPLALATGFLILLRADRRGHAIVAGVSMRTLVTLTLTPLLAVQFGVVAAVWGIAIGTTIGSAAAIFYGLRSQDIALRSNPGIVNSDTR